MKLLTEEDVKIKVVIPFLKKLGFQEDELYFEKTFKLYLGRFTYKVNTEEQYQEAEGRLDILVKRNNKNLFIVEVKNPSQYIHEKDIEQATSYAKLLHPVAPFVILTNGKDYKIYDSLSRLEIEYENFQIKSDYQIGINETQRYEALKYFLGYSKKNLLIFCQEQVKEGMITLMGSKDNPSKKFIPELHTPRKKLSQEFDNFTDNETATVFSIIGDSGSGKTSSMCQLALDLLENGYPVLFYKASILSGGIFKSIAGDFNWSFSSQYSEIEIFKRIEDLFESGNLVIFIDAIDVWNLHNKVEILNYFVLKLHDRKFKIVLSCKTNAWSDFLVQKDTPTELSEFNYIHDKKQGYYLDELDWEEFSNVLIKYRTFYNYYGTFEKRVLDECKRIPFLLRVCFEVMQEYNLDKITFSCKEFFHEYYKRTINKMENKLVAEATLKAVAKCLFDNNSDLIDIDLLQKEIGFNATSLPALFEYNILEIISGIFDTKIKFYFDKFRDYIIAFRVLKMQENQRPFDNLIHDGIQKDVMKFYYPLADIRQQRTIDGIIRDNAEKYLNFYVDVINDNFEEFKESFNPHTKKNIGFIGELNIFRKELIRYGFRALDNSNEARVLFIPLDQPDLHKFPDVCYIHGARTLHYKSSTNYFRNLNIDKEVLEGEVVPQLVDIIKLGLLNEKDNIYLLIEKIIALKSGFQFKKYIIKENQKLSKFFPIIFDEIEFNLRYEKACRIFEHKLIQERIQKREIKREWRGSIVSFHYCLSQEDIAYIQRNAEIAARGESEIESEIRFQDFEKIEKILYKSIHSLRNQGINSIDEFILPKPDKPPSSGYIWDYYSKERLIEYVLKVYELFLEEYKKIIETNFGSLKKYFQLYSIMPIKCFISLTPGGERTGVNIDICYNRDTEHNEIVMANYNEMAHYYNPWRLRYRGNEIELILSYGMDISTIFYRMQQDHLNIKLTSGAIPIRNLVYDQIASEIGILIDYLFKKYNVPNSQDKLYL